MANYELVVNSKFQPFSFERYIQPYQIYGQAYKEVENTLGELDAKASVWEEMANEQTDPYAYKMYKTYANDLEEQAGQLAREGLNAASRRDMLNMRARYSKEIAPIEQAYAARQRQAEQQQQALLQDPTLMLSRRAATTSLDDYIKNPQLAYESYSGKLITAQVASAAAALSKQMRENPRKWRSILHDSYYETLMQKGIPSDIISKFLYYADDIIYNNLNPETVGIPSELSSKLQDVLEAPLASSGMRDWKNNMSKSDWKALVTRANAYARQGLWSAVGETQYQVLDNWRAKMAAQEAMQKRAEARAAARARQQQALTNGLALNPSNIYSSRELSKDEKRYKDNMKNYSKYFYRDAQGKLRMTWAGWTEYNRNAKPKKVTVAGSGSGTAALMNEETQMQNDNDSRKFIPTAFRRFMDSIGAHNATKGKWQPGNLGNVWNRYVTNSPEAETAKYDAMKATEYIYDVPASDEYQNNFKSKLSRVIGSNGKLTEVDYDPKTNKWVPTGETLSFDKFNTKDYRLVSRAPSEIGYTKTPNKPSSTWFILKDGEKKAKRYLAIPGIHTTAEGGRDEAITQMLITQRMLQNPNLTPQQRAKLENHYDNLTQQEIMFESQLDLTNQTSTQNINPYYVP